MADLDIGHLRGHRHQIIGHGGVGELAALVINAVLEERRAQPLDHAAADLLVDELRVDDRAAILDHPVLEQADEAGVGIDLQPGALDAICEGEGIFARYEMAHRHHLSLEARRQGVGAEIDDPAQLGQADALTAAFGIDDILADDVQAVRFGLKDGRRGGKNIPAQETTGLPGRLAANAGTA